MSLWCPCPRILARHFEYKGYMISLIFLFLVSNSLWTGYLFHGYVFGPILGWYFYRFEMESDFMIDMVRVMSWHLSKYDYHRYPKHRFIPLWRCQLDILAVFREAKQIHVFCTVSHFMMKISHVWKNTQSIRAAHLMAVADFWALKFIGDQVRRDPYSTYPLLLLVDDACINRQSYSETSLLFPGQRFSPARDGCK